MKFINTKKLLKVYYFKIRKNISFKVFDLPLDSEHTLK